MSAKRCRAEKTYAKYLSAYLSEYEKRDVHIHFLHPQNEVTADQSFPSCLYTGEEFKNFVAGYLCAEISRNNPGTQIWLGTINSHSFEDYAFRFFEDKKLSKKIGGIGYQWIGEESVCKTRASFPRVPIVQTESECGDGENTFAFAEYIFSLMQHYLTNGAEAYVYWNMILGSDPYSTWDWAQNSLITVDENSRTWRKNPEYWLMKHFSAFLHRGDETVRCTGAWSGNSVAARRAPLSCRKQEIGRRVCGGGRPALRRHRAQDKKDVFIFILNGKAFQARRRSMPGFF